MYKKSYRTTQASALALALAALAKPKGFCVKVFM